MRRGAMTISESPDSDSEYTGALGPGVPRRWGQPPPPRLTSVGMATPDHGDHTRWLSQEQRDRLADPDHARFLEDVRGNLIHLSTADLERAMVGGSEDFQLICREVLRSRGVDT